MKRIFSGLFFTQALNLLIKPVWILLIDLAVQNNLSKESYGEYFASLHLTLLFVILLDPGLHNFLIKEVATDGKKAWSYLRSSVRFKGLLCLLYLASLGLAAVIFRYESHQFYLLLILGVFQIGVSLIQYGRAFLTSFQEFRWDGIFSVAERAISIVLVALLIWGGASHFSLTIFRFAGAQMIAAVVALGAMSWVIYKIIPRNPSGESPISLKTILKKAWPFALLTALMGFYTYMDSQMLKLISIHGVEDVSDYAMAYRPYFAALMFAQLFAMYLLPVMSSAIANQSTYQKLAHHVFSILFFGVMLLSFIIYLYGHTVSDLMYAERGTIKIAKAMFLLMFGLIANAFTFVFGTALTAQGKLKELNGLALISVVINLSLNYFLIPQEGIIGAAIATLVAQSFFGLSCYFLCVVKGYAALKVWWWIKWGGFSVVMIVFKSLIQSQSFLWYQNIIAITMIGLALALVLRLIDFKDIKADFVEKSKV